MPPKEKSTDQLIEEISMRLTLVLERSLENLSKTVETQFEQAVSKLTDKIATSFEQMVQDLSLNLNKTMMESSKSMQKIGIEQLVTSTKQKHLRMWNQTLNKRKTAYWKHLRAEEIANTYANWLEETPAKIAKKFQPTPVEGESNEQVRIKKEIAETRVQGEIRLLRAQASQHRETFEECDNEINMFLSSQDSEIREALWELWREDTTKEEMRSKSIWEKKKEWFLSDEPTESKARGKASIVGQTIRNVINGNIDKSTAKKLTYAQAAQTLHPQKKNNPQKTREARRRKVTYQQPNRTRDDTPEPANTNESGFLKRNTGARPKQFKKTTNEGDFLGQGHKRGRPKD